MTKTHRASSARPTPRTLVWASAILSSAALVSAAGCTSGDVDSPGGIGANAGTGAASSGGAGGLSGNGGTHQSAGTAGTTGGSAGSTGAGSGSGGTLTGSGGSGTGGSLAGSGGTGNGGMSTGGTSNGGMSTGGTAGNPEPCVDVEPPPDPTWPDATCQSWATETEECGAAWFADYCDASCGRCTPEGSGGTSGSGGSAGSGTGGSTSVDCSNADLPNVSGGDGFATRYWDCCQPHCAQFDGHRCNQDGTSNSGSNQSACAGGGAFACYDEAPRAVSDCLSYGHIAKANPNCGACYRIEFTGEGQHNAADPGSQAIRGKQMIVKVTNTGSDVAGNQFDLMIPGGGVGQFDACSRQWGTSDLGAQYGGFLTECTGTHQQKKDCVRQECMKVPSGRAREGCLWFVDWLEVADNPKFTSQQTDCPF